MPQISLINTDFFHRLGSKGNSVFKNFQKSMQPTFSRMAGASVERLASLYSILTFQYYSLNMFKRCVFFWFLLLGSCFCSYSQTVKADDIIGNWLTGSKKGVVQIYKDGNKYIGKIIWLKNPTYEDGKPKLDKHNPDKAKKNGSVMGLNMLEGFVFENDKWVDGTIYDPENGKTYSCKITKKADILSVRGFIGISLLGRTDTWYKVQAKQ